MIWDGRRIPWRAYKRVGVQCYGIDRIDRIDRNDGNGLVVPFCLFPLLSFIHEEGTDDPAAVRLRLYINAGSGFWATGEHLLTRSDGWRPVSQRQIPQAWQSEIERAMRIEDEIQAEIRR